MDHKAWVCRESRATSREKPQLTAAEEWPGGDIKRSDHGAARLGSARRLEEEAGLYARCVCTQSPAAAGTYTNSPIPDNDNCPSDREGMGVKVA